MQWKRLAKALAWTLREQAFDLFNSILLPPMRDQLHTAVGVGPNPWITRSLWSAKTIDGAVVSGVVPGTAYAKFTLPNGLPADGKRSLAIENDPHTLDAFDGVIEAGYGKGTKSLLYRDKVIVKIQGRTFPSIMEYHFHDADVAGPHYDLCVENVPSGTNKFEINVPNGPFKGRFAFTPTNRGLLVVPMKDRGLVLPKPDYTLKTEDFFAKVRTEPGWVVEQKIDGSLANAVVEDNRAHFRSHRETGSTYYDKLPQLEFLHNNSPLYSCRVIFPGPAIHRSIFKGELVHPDGVPRVAGILNALPHRARQMQTLRGPVRYYVWDILKYNGRDVSRLPYESRRLLAEQAVAEIRRFNSNWDIVQRCPEGTDPHEFYRQITAQPLPYGEGVVLKKAGQAHGEGPWYKVKERDYQDFEVIEIQEGRGKYADTVGRFVVRNPNNGAVGEIGSFAINDQQRQWIWDHRSELLPITKNVDAFSGSYGRLSGRLSRPEGLIAKCLVMDVTERGAPRAGVFVAFHEGKGSTEAGLRMYSESLAGGDPIIAKNTMYALKSAAGWNKS